MYPRDFESKKTSVGRSVHRLRDEIFHGVASFEAARSRGARPTGRSSAAPPPLRPFLIYSPRGR